MNAAQLLDMLQDLDLESDRLSGQLVALQGSLHEPDALQEARSAWQDAEKALDGERKPVQDREWEARRGRDKIAAAEAKLYSGRVTSPKELDNLYRDLESLKAQQAALDERLLEAMIAVEEAQARAKASREHLAQTEAAWQAEQARLNTDGARLHQQIASLQARRQAQAAMIDRASLAAYEQLRPARGGRAVARLVGDVCQACRLTLPSGDAARVRQSLGLVFCANCGRILCK